MLGHGDGASYDHGDEGGVHPRRPVPADVAIVGHGTIEPETVDVDTGGSVVAGGGLVVVVVTAGGGSTVQQIR